MNKLMSLAVVAMALLLPRPAVGVVLLNQDQALKQMFPDPAKVTPELVVLTQAQGEAAKANLGGKWTLYDAGSKAGAVTNSDSVTFFHATKEGKKVGAAVVEVQPGKWGPVKYIVALDPAGKVTNLAVMSYVEQRGRPIATRRFLDQFIGKTGQSAITVGKDIDAVSGATISSRATAFAVKKVVALYQAVYLCGAEK